MNVQIFLTFTIIKNRIIILFPAYTYTKEREREEKSMQGQWSEAIDIIKEQLATARSRLNYATDRDMIDALIYEIKSLQHKYNFYIRLCRENRAKEPNEAI